MELDMLDQAFEALKTYDWGTDPKVLSPIDEALVATRGDAAARQELEARLVAVLKTDVSRDAKDFVCRKLTVIGTAASVPALAELLPAKDSSHMARYALERIPVPEAAQAMRDALPKLDNALKLGVMGSLGVRQDVASVPALVALLGDPDVAVARSAALALGAIRAPEAARALREAKPEKIEAKTAVTDACLACAEGLLAAGKKGEAMEVYKAFIGEDQPKHIRLAATRGMLACAGKSD
jgi:HEAT repeat protein